MKTIAITGASGFLGRHVQARLREAGHHVLPFVRSEPGSDEVQWSPPDGTIDIEGLRNCDAVVHLAGEPVVGLRWTEKKKERILESRRLGTRLIAETLATLARTGSGPQVLVSVSGVGYYGTDRGDEVLTEASSRGEGFLAEVCEVWESSADPARAADVRVVHPRIGLVLDPDDGVLAKMLPAFRLGVGGEVGGGKQWFPWVSIDDVASALLFCIGQPDVHGPVNLCAPHPVTNETFTHTLGKVLHRPTAIPLPKFAVKLAMGEMGEQTLLAGQRAIPQALLAAGFRFQDEELEPTLRRLLAH